VEELALGMMIMEGRSVTQKPSVRACVCHEDDDDNTRLTAIFQDIPHKMVPE